MSVICVDWETAHLHGEAWISHHRLRHRVFVERQGWCVPNINGLEYDEFDTPAAKYILWLDDRGQARGVARLIPTTRPYMVKQLWPHLVDGSLPESPSIWEATRFGFDRDLDKAIRRRAVAELICACQEFGIQHGVRAYLSVMPLHIFKRVIAPAGCPVEPLGAPARFGRYPTAAAYISVSTEVLTRVRRRGQLSGQVLGCDTSLAA